MDVNELKSVATGIQIPLAPSLDVFSQEQRDALQPFVDSMEGLSRLVDGIRNLPDATPQAAPAMPLPGTQVLGAEPESQPAVLPTYIPDGDAENEMLRCDNTAKEWVILDAPDTDYKVLQRKADDTIGWDWVRAH